MTGLGENMDTHPATRWTQFITPLRRDYCAYLFFLAVGGKRRAVRADNRERW